MRLMGQRSFVSKPIDQAILGYRNGPQARSSGDNEILVEGGSAMAGSLLAANLLDRIAWFRAPKLMGDDGIAAISALGTDRMEDLLQFRTILSKPLGQDRLDILERTR